jgi:hypothetical protein
MKLRIGSVLLASAVCGCAYQVTRYAPLGAPAGGEMPAVATYPVGGDGGEGAIAVVVLEGERLPVGRGAPELYLHVRLEAQNRSDRAGWALNPNDQLLSYAGGLVPASFSRTSAGTPVLSLPAGTHGTLDLYFPLPAEVDPPEVSVWWRLRRAGAGAVVAETTRLRRIAGRDAYDPFYEGSPEPALPTLALGWWWPDYCLHAQPYGQGRRWYGRRSYGYDEESAGASSGGSSSSPTSASSSSDSSSSDSGANWRNPSAPSGPDPGASEKSAWRGGGR